MVSCAISQAGDDQRVGRYRGSARRSGAEPVDASRRYGRFAKKRNAVRRGSDYSLRRYASASSPGCGSPAMRQATYGLPNVESQGQVRYPYISTLAALILCLPKAGEHSPLFDVL